MSQTLQLETYVPYPMIGDCVSENHTLIDPIISYALCVVPAYAWNTVALPI